jgi:hypothetical protein
VNEKEINKAFDEEYIKYRAAFPTGILTDDKGKIIGGSNGMTLRDYFAAKAMQGLLASEVNAPMKTFANMAYNMADLMMEARNGSQ